MVDQRKLEEDPNYYFACKQLMRSGIQPSTILGSPVGTTKFCNECIHQLSCLSAPAGDSGAARSGRWLRSKEGDA